MKGKVSNCRWKEVEERKKWRERYWGRGFRGEKE